MAAASRVRDRCREAMDNILFSAHAKDYCEAIDLDHSVNALN
jgi:hypothetical protein